MTGERGRRVVRITAAVVAAVGGIAIAFVFGLGWLFLAASVAADPTPPPGAQAPLRLMLLIAAGCVFACVLLAVSGVAAPRGAGPRGSRLVRLAAAVYALAAATIVFIWWRWPQHDDVLPMALACLLLALLTPWWRYR